MDVDATHAAGTPVDTGPPHGPDVTLPISAVADRTGISPSTLRVWQRRYGLGATRTSPGGHRRYGADDVRRIEAAQRLVGQGVSVADAARVVLAAQAPAPPTGGDVYPGTATLWTADDELVLPLAADPAAHRLGAAAMNLDGPLVRTLMQQYLDRHGVVATWEAVLRPVLAAIGRHWADLPLGIAVEHMVSHIATTVLTETASRVDARHAPAVLLSSHPGEEHVLPLLVLAAALGERGDVAAVLDPRLSPAEAPPGVDVVVVFVLLPQFAETAALDAFGPSALIAAGPGWNRAELPARVHHVDDVQAALDLILDLTRTVGA
ncbi:MAG: MerR family transcriptional regulator [Pseudonocardia sediminis]